MRKIILFLSLYAMCLAALAQTYTFESDYAGWSADHGLMYIDTTHYKQGTHALHWRVNQRSTLIVSGFSAFQTSTSNAAFMQIFSPTEGQDTLLIEFMNGTSTQRKAQWLLNYYGWREFNRAYTEYATRTNAQINAVRITYIPASSLTRDIYFDDVRLNSSIDVYAVPGTGQVLDVDYVGYRGSRSIGHSNTHYPLLRYSNPVDLPLTEPTDEERRGLDTLRVRLKPALAQNTTGAVLARNWVNNTIRVVRNADGTPHGTLINTSGSHLVADSLAVILDRLVALGSGKVYNTSGCAAAFDNYMDLLLEQGLGEGANIIYQSNSYTAPRTIIPKMLSVLPACNDTQRTRWLGLLRWVSFYGSLFYPEDTWHANVVSDELYLFLVYEETIAAWHLDDGEAVRQLRAVKRYLERCLSYTPGGYDMLKPDGTGFHHNTHYNNYMYSYQTVSTGIYNLRNTCYQISEEAFSRFAKAVESIYVMATPSKNDTRFYANSLCGRNPFHSGVKMAYAKTYLQNLIAASTVYSDLNSRLKADLNYFFQTSTYSVPAVSYEGFHQFNYSPCGVMRNGHWVATMRAPTTRFWGAEIYSGENRFGRYQSHGSLDVMYQGTTMAYSGYPTNETGGGWDWNVIPGTTTVHYTSWQDMMPSRNTTARHDQYTASTNFSGAVGDGMTGVWACNFDQKDAWGTAARFTPTNLKFKKSVFCFDSLLVALGTDISASGSYSDDMITATNLFQCITSAVTGDLTVDATTRSAGESVTLSTDAAHWMVTPVTTGYYVPAGNDPVRVVYGTQQSPKESGADYASPTTTATAAKAYIDHGVKTSGRRYEFVVVPSTTPERMAALAARIAGGNVYHVMSQTSTLHAVQADSTTGYAFFSATDDVGFGIVRSTTHQHLLIDRQLASGAHRIALCNPNLEPELVSNPAVNTGWESRATTTTITFDGEWQLKESVEGVVVEPPVNGTTRLDVTFTDAEPIYLTLVPYGTSHLASVADGSVRIMRNSSCVRIMMGDLNGGRCCLYAADGRCVASAHASAGCVEFPVDMLPAGIYLCVAGNRVVKFAL